MDEERKQIEMLEKQLRAMQEELEDTVRKFDRRIRALEQAEAPDITAFASMLEDQAYTMSLVDGTSSDNDFGDTEV